MTDVTRWLSPAAAKAIPMRRGGPSWVNGLEVRVLEAAARFGVEVGNPLGGGSMSCVLATTGPDGPVVVKLSPDRTAVRREAACYGAWAAAAATRDAPAPCPEVLAFDDELGAMCMSFVSGAKPPKVDDVAELDAELDAVAGLAGIIAAAPAPVELVEPGRFLTSRTRLITGRLTAFSAAGGMSSSDLARWLEAVAAGAAAHRDLLSGEARHACHGDLWRANLLVDDGSWQLIDPYGLAGHAAVDVAFWAAGSGHGVLWSERVTGLAERCRFDVTQLAALSRFWLADRLAVSVHYGWDVEHRAAAMTEAIAAPL